ncbi:MAG: septation protein A [Albimonas sp.]|uniref:septation protein A n=1 Tax=Albimonas sp. TaxID=1872425 RepID=UPI004056766F|tara:strand:- start:1088 stop:1684 length:597 start_codon:yes stop_codon:yes gene_type:complete
METPTKPLNPLVKAALEFGPLVLFFVVYQRTDIFTATAVFIPTILGSLGVSWWLSRDVPRMAVVTAVVVVVFGGLTLWLKDATFIKMKPTIINTLFAAALGWGLLRGRSYLKDLIGGAMPLTDAGWMILTRRWALFFLFMAALNEVVWRTQTEEFWVTFKTFASPAITFVFIVSQFGLFKKHGTEGASGEGGGGSSQA